MGENGLSRFTDEETTLRFHTLTEHMLKVNESMNLTAIKEPRAVILLHFADSLSIEKLLPENATVADIGCGAGFPTLPLAICRPDLSFLAIDSTAKRIAYVEDTCRLLSLTNVKALATRAEDAGRGEFRGKFDVCTARAVAALPVLSELCLPFLKKGGKFLAMKGKRGEEEWQDATRATATLGGKLITRHTVTLVDSEKGENDTRIILEVEKVAPTPPQYPRPYAKILKKPL